MSVDVTTGNPYWKMWQSRVLGPYTIKALTFGGLEPVRAHYLFQILTVANRSLLVLASRKEIWWQ